LHELAFASDARTALTMSRGATLAGRAETFFAQQAAERLATAVQAFDFVELFAEMVVVERSGKGVRRRWHTPNLPGCRC
jgi:hypothetical protein